MADTRQELIYRYLYLVSVRYKNIGIIMKHSPRIDIGIVTVTGDNDIGLGEISRIFIVVSMNNR